MARTMFISAAHGIILNALAMGEKEDRAVGPNEVAEVPFSYGRHLVDDRFAVEVDPPAKKKAAKPKSDDKNDAALTAAADAVTAAQAKLDAAGDDADLKAAAEQDLAEAEAALAALKA